ncbi:MAG: redoxin domain-containing protein [Verrucomicrobiales bacterium]|nr:redoxin domain-containing protein [Verrucomicrobiales bacterium]
MNYSTPSTAPEFSVSSWLNTNEDLTLVNLRGKVVVLHAFQMLCPGCTLHGIPQAKEISRVFGGNNLQVIGLHSVFEHHEVMTNKALKVFIDEYRLPFPVAVDNLHQGSKIPETMEAYEMQGTPSTVLIDHLGRVRFHHFGQISDLQMGAHIGNLLAELTASRSN